MEESSEAARSRNIHDYERGKERNKGLQLFWQQFCALMKKNFLLSWRNKPATFMQLASSFFFVFLIFCCDKAWNMSYFSGSSFVDETDPQYKVVGGILPCEEGYFIKSPCFDFIWTGNTSSSAINSIVTSIMARNPGRPIPSSKVRGFETPEEADEWLYSNPMRCTGGLYFMERGNSVISYGLQTNSTSKQWRGYTEDPTLKFQIPLQAAAEREIARYLLQGGACCCNNTALPSSDGNPNDEDVAAEELLVKMQVDERNRDPVVAIQVCGLVKSFPGSRKISCCCKCRKTPPHHAVKGIWLNIEKNKLFCLLGHNGAGKTTTINCLTGVLPITAGDALIYGHSIKDRSGRLNIQNLMGICPQFDILWGILSAKEHIHLFASIKGLPTSSIKLDANKLLSQVKLSDVAHIQARTYSGGMKRRLSVAIALIGDPKLVFLDEPTTGMDPVMRRHVWEIIQHAKKDRAIVLTTHSMEEADILSDRIAVMARGKLQCIGSSVHLKSRFGDGFVATVCVKKKKVYHNSENVNGDLECGDDIENNQVKRFFRERLNIEVKEEHNGRIIFNIPQEKEELLKEFFSELSNKEEELGITDITLSLATLEEVFLNITKESRS